MLLIAIAKACMGRVRMLRDRVATLDTRIAKPAEKKALPFYSTPEWRALMNRLFKERGRRCEDPRCARPHGPWGQLYGDHIIELRDGGADLDPANVLIRCAPCHGRKTAEARATRQANDGDLLN